ncbi:MAG: cell division FtsZ family protein [Deltaproteobacteria bacterium]|jgi:cell division protein FtsZ|nr:cell division FtsZ family protein [Deltaproteobacteria bacterium]
MDKTKKHAIAIFGLGGAGGNAVSHMIRSGLAGPTFVAADSDAQALRRGLAPTKIQIGSWLKKGQGCGGQAQVGAKCVEESLEDVLKALAGSDLVFLTAGLGGGTGGGGAPVVARALAGLARPPVTVAVVAMPFSHEDFRRPLAERALNSLYDACHSVLAIDNAKLEALDPEASILANLARGDDVLRRAVASVVGLVDTPGEINVDFADVAAALSHKGPAIISHGEAKGEKRAAEALRKALDNPLAACASLEGAQAVVCDIAADEGVLAREVMEVNQRIRRAIGPGAKLFFGLVVDESLKESSSLRVTILAAGLPRPAFLAQAAPQSTGPQSAVHQSVVNQSAVHQEIDPKATDPKVAAPASRALRPAHRIFPIESLRPTPKVKAFPPRLILEAPIAPSPKPDFNLMVPPPPPPEKAPAPPAVAPGPYAAAARRTVRKGLGTLGERARGPGDSRPGEPSVNENPGYYERPRYIRKPAD